MTWRHYYAALCLVPGAVLTALGPEALLVGVVFIALGLVVWTWTALTERDDA